MNNKPTMKIVSPETNLSFIHMTKRDYIATAIFQGMLNSSGPIFSSKTLISDAIRITDKFIKALDETEDETKKEKNDERK